MLLFKAFSLVHFHFFSAASAVFDEIDVRVLLLFSMKADSLRNLKNGGTLELVRDRQL